MKFGISSLALVGFLVAAPCFAEISFPEGTYATLDESRGIWKDSSGKSGNQQVEVEIKDNVVKSTYTFDENQEPVVLVWRAKFAENGFFQVVATDNEVYGKGYCFYIEAKKLTECHLSMVFGSQAVEESYTFLDDKLYVTGSKNADDADVAWTQELARK